MLLLFLLLLLLLLLQLLFLLLLLLLLMLLLLWLLLLMLLFATVTAEYTMTNVLQEFPKTRRSPHACKSAGSKHAFVFSGV